MSRKDEIAANLAAIQRRIDRACAAAGRPRSSVTLIAVTKTFPAADIRLLADLGVTDIAENRDAEATPKVRECADLPLTWHFVGQLQTNKARSVARYADLVHSVDRPRLVAELGKQAARARRTVRCLIQVRLDSDPRRGGVDPAGVLELAAAVAGHSRLGLAGVMAIPPLQAEPAAAYRRLADIAMDLSARYPAATVISAGMSGDLEEAIGQGATHVRVGTALLGRRTPLVR